MTQKELSKEDEKRIKNCDFYLQTKNIMKSHDEYKELNLGEVYFIKEPKYDRYVSRGYNGKPDKFMIFHKDEEGFVFIKRINVSGKLGKEVQCLTTQYPMPRYEIEPDPEYVDSILFENEGGYDPLKAEKELNSKKGKARRRNKRLEIHFETESEAYEYLKGLAVGEKLYDAETSYGSGIMEWVVDSINKYPVDKEKMNRYGGHIHTEHNRNGFNEVVEVKLVSNSPKRRYTSADTTVDFRDFLKRSYSCSYYYKSKPYTTDDF